MLRFWGAVVGVVICACGASSRPFSQQRAPAGMILIPPGSFAMGSEGSNDTQPIHEVELAAFYMDTTEVTASAYGACIQAGTCQPTVDIPGCNASGGEQANHPINCVDWYHADTYCRWAKKRLPTEEEWEYAARAARTAKYPWGDDPPGSQLCWRGVLDTTSTCGVASFPQGRSPFGVMDMAGNVWEWTASGFSESYREPRKDDRRVVRGGGFGDADPDYVTAVGRGRQQPEYVSKMFGFRCARSVSQR